MASAPFFAAVVGMLEGYTQWTRVETLTVIIGAFAFGIPGGLILRQFARVMESVETREVNRSRLQ